MLIICLRISKHEGRCLLGQVYGSKAAPSLDVKVLLHCWEVSEGQSWGSWEDDW